MYDGSMEVEALRRQASWLLARGLDAEALATLEAAADRLAESDPP